MKNGKKFLTVILAVILAISMLAGCAGQPPVAPTPAPAPAPAPSSETGSSVAGTPAGEQTLPLSAEKVTFKGFYAIPKAEFDLNNNASMKALSEKTNIYFDWNCQAQGAGAAEAFNLMLTSGDLPDVVIMDNINFPGGYEAAMEDGLIWDLKELLPKYAPHYWTELSSNPQALSDVVTPGGHIPGVFQYSKDLYNNKPIALMGMAVRGDWLEELNLPVPQTIDDWYTMLTAFKEKKGAKFPLVIGPTNGVEGTGMFMSAYGISAPPASYNPAPQNFYPDANGKMKYGALEQGYQEFLQTFSKWYAEGLYDRDFTTRGARDLPGRAALVGKNDTGAVAIYVDWEGLFNGSAQDENFKLTYVPYPAKKAGEAQSISLAKSPYADFPLVITKKCKNPELVLSFIDYISYGDGLISKVYGIENDTYTMVNGVPKFTDKIMKSDFGVTDSWQIFTGNFYPVKPSDLEMQSQLYSKEMLAKKKVWQDSSNPLIQTWQLTAAEGEELNSIMTDIKAYVEEQTVKAIMDQKIAANWMDVQAKQVQSMNIDRALEIMQIAYDRYIAAGK